MKNFRKIGSSFLDRLCGIWSPIPLEVRSCALRQSISTPPWQQQCSPNDCTMGSKLFYCVETFLLCQNCFIGKNNNTCTARSRASVPEPIGTPSDGILHQNSCLLRQLCQNYFIVSDYGDSKGASDNHSLFTLKNKAYFDPKKYIFKPNLFCGSMIWILNLVCSWKYENKHPQKKDVLAKFQPSVWPAEKSHFTKK